jgi:AcrR family transcriptional regulator
MQILKTEIHDSILENAEKMFFSLGYHGTSTRELSKKVGVSYSNLYRYFENKNDLFEAVMQPYYALFSETFIKFLEHEEKEITDSRHTDSIIQVFMRLIQTDRKKFVILMEGSQGTRYEGVRHDIIASIENRIELSLNHAFAKNTPVIKVIAANLLNAILKIARTTVDDNTLQKNIKILVIYHLAGIQKLSEL